MDKRPERKNVTGLFAPAGPLVLQNSKLDHVNAEMLLVSTSTAKASTPKCVLM
jgi:hypothetical protein